MASVPSGSKPTGTKVANWSTSAMTLKSTASRTCLEQAVQPHDCQSKASGTWPNGFYHFGCIGSLRSSFNGIHGYLFIGLHLCDAAVLRSALLPVPAGRIGYDMANPALPARLRISSIFALTSPVPAGRLERTWYSGIILQSVDSQNWYTDLSDTKSHSRPGNGPGRATLRHRHRWASMDPTHRG